MTAALPIDALRTDFDAAVLGGHVVVSAPTGSGKSTQIPRWLQARGRVLVVEPRRVAAQSLAARVAELEGGKPGQKIGYVVRDEAVICDDTAVVFVTPGVALRWYQRDRLADFDVVVLDEFHERALDLDLILALALADGRLRLVLMSATLAGDRIAAHVGGVHLRGEGRLFPVDVRYVAGRAAAPDVRGLEERVRSALEQAQGEQGDVLVFLPGKGEIASVARALGSPPGWEVLALHGGLTLREQRRVFGRSDKRRVVLATNVAETSLTIPGIGVVIDSGLVRRTRYRGGRGYLTLMPVAADSAQQRVGRAGRLGPGVGYRLWRQDVRLVAGTPPEIHREDLTPLVLSAAACGHPELDLPFLDAPKSHAVEAARAHLAGLGAVDAEGRITRRGRRLFRMPLDAHLGRLLVEAEVRGTLGMVVPLCAALSISRRLFLRRPEDPEDDLRAEGCDAVGAIRAVREGRAGRHGLDRQALTDARAALGRLASVMGMAVDELGARRLIDRAALGATLLAAWPRCAHVRRRRKRHVAWANGGTELELGRGSAVDPEKTEALIVLESRAFSLSYGKNPLVITAAMPAPLQWLAAAGRGRERLGGIQLVRGALVGRIEVVYAGKVLTSQESAPSGPLCREAVRDLFVRGSLFKGTLQEARHRHERLSLKRRLDGAEVLPPFPDWVLRRLEELGLEEAEDLALLDGDDLLPAALEPWEGAALDRTHPPALSVGDASYALRYDVGARTVTLHQIRGLRKTPPPSQLLPVLSGWTVVWEFKNRKRTLRRG